MGGNATQGWQPRPGADEWIARRQKIPLNETNSEWRPMISSPIATRREGKTPGGWSGLHRGTTGLRPGVSVKLFQRPTLYSPLVGCKMRKFISAELIVPHARALRATLAKNRDWKHLFASASQKNISTREFTAACFPTKYGGPWIAVHRTMSLFPVFSYFALSDERVMFMKENFKKLLIRIKRPRFIIERIEKCHTRLRNMFDITEVIFLYFLHIKLSTITEWNNKRNMLFGSILYLFLHS